MAAVESIFASVNPAVSNANSLNKSLEKAVRLMASLQTPPLSIRKATYESLTKVFDRVRKEGKGDSIDFDLTDLKSLLFGPDETIEALRLGRVDAIKAIQISAPLVSSKMNGGEPSH